MGIREAPAVKFCGCVVLILALLFAVVTVPLSFKSLEQGKQGLEFKWSTQSVSTNPITKTGIRFVGLGNQILEYPSTYQNVWFVADTRGLDQHAKLEEDMLKPVIRGPVRARSKDGLEMLIAVSFQYQLLSNAIVPLNEILGYETYKPEFVRFARAAIVEACSAFPAELYFTNRTPIIDHMREVLQENFQRPDKGLFVAIKGLQLKEVDLPDEYDEEIANTQEQQQETAIAFAERGEQIVVKQREIAVAVEAALTVLELARGEAERIRLENGAEVAQMLIFQSRQATAYAEILNQRFENNSQPFQRMLEIMELRTVDGHGSNKLMMSL